MDRTPNASGDRRAGRRLPRLGRALLVAISVVGAFLIYAYGFQVTKVNLEETRSPRRQEQLVRILRALAQPDLVEYDQRETTGESAVFVPCPVGPPATPLQVGSPRLLLDPTCGSPGEWLRVRGEGFPAGADGRVYFVPPNGILLSVGDFHSDRQGAFEVRVQLPERPTPEAQTLLAIARENIGAPRLTQNAHDTWDKIIETIFMALLGTTFGTMIAVPLSFLAARNLMKDVTGTIGGLALIVISLPVGAWLGFAFWRMALAGSSLVTSNPLALLVVTCAALAILGGALRWAMPAVEPSTPTRMLRAVRAVVVLLCGLLGLLAAVLIARLMVFVGNELAGLLELASFVGTFVFALGEALELILGAVAIGTGAVVLGNGAGRLVRRARIHLAPAADRILDLAIVALAGAVAGLLLGAVLEWLYRLEDPRLTVIGPAAIGALVGLLLGVRAGAGDTFPVGLVVYNFTRTILNVLRAVEPVIMVIVIAVWVGIGPFAGVLALSLHTVAALGKLFSEHVETVLPGPLEAVTATGATRLQMIVYAVVPQIVPTYVSLTMYRWDINVRMSTIIGFAGGGGIGFLLQQNANLSNYRAASAQILAIALVVTAMDYLSSYLRQKAI
jgi:phosphonate ABC transporter permease subunit PhnE